MNPHELRDVEVYALEAERDALHEKLGIFSPPWNGVSDPRRVQYESAYARYETIDRRLELHYGDLEEEW